MASRADMVLKPKLQELFGLEATEKYKRMVSQILLTESSSTY